MKPRRAVTIAATLAFWGLVLTGLGVVFVLVKALAGGDVHVPLGIRSRVVHIDDPDGVTTGLAAIRGVLPLVVAGPIIWLAHAILRSARDGDPFVTDNVRRLRWIAVVLIVGVPLVTIVGNGLLDAIADRADVDAWTAPLEIPGPGPLAGIGVLALAEVFAHGVRLRDELEGTV